MVVMPSHGWAQGGLGLIYGDDDRQNEFQITDQTLLEVGDSTVVLVDSSGLSPSIRQNSDGAFTLANNLFGNRSRDVKINPNDPGFCGDGTTACVNFPTACSGERFIKEPAPGFCSGFLVAPDMVATAAHCIQEANTAGHGSLLNDIFFVFGFVVDSPGNTVLNHDEDNVYRATALVQFGWNDTEGSARYGEDWALVRLDRVVTNHLPLDIRSTNRHGARGPQSAISVIGHPSGLPRKYAVGAALLDSTSDIFFSINSDTYAGNSGSAVVYDGSFLVEGILVRGEDDFVAGDDNGDGTDDCWRSNVLPDSQGAEAVTRSTVFSEHVPIVIFVGPHNSSGSEGNELGTRAYPFDTVTEGINAVPTQNSPDHPRGGTLIILAGNYSENLTIDKAVTLYSRNGVVQIGN